MEMWALDLGRMLDTFPCVHLSLQQFAYIIGGMYVTLSICISCYRVVDGPHTHEDIFLLMNMVKRHAKLYIVLLCSLFTVLCYYKRGSFRISIKFSEPEKEGIPSATTSMGT